MKKNNPGVILPSLPSKSILAKLNQKIIENMQNELMEERKFSLELFINYVNKN